MEQDTKEDFVPNQSTGLVLFGRDISKIPCFRNSLLFGMSSGMALGLGHFMFKSRPLQACNFAVWSFSAATLLYWGQCRYKFSAERFEMLKLQELMRQNAIHEGTKQDV